MVRVPIWGGGDDYWSLLVADVTKPAWEAFNRELEAFDYPFVESAGGTYNCRFIGGTNTWSTHAYGLALDINPSKNKYGGPTEDNYPDGFVESVESLNIDNVPLFTWGGRWSNDDDMHWQINVPPSASWDNIKGGSDDLAILTEEDQHALKDWLNRLGDLESTVAYISYLIPDIRKNIITADELAAAIAAVETSSVDEHARGLAQKALNKLAAIKAAL
jgi:hypothetical protein